MKIALVGSSPSSIALAPYGDPEWTIWGCSTGAYPHLQRVDAFFEIHRWRPGEDGFTPGLIEWMAGLECPVYMMEKRPEVPSSVAYPKDDILAKYPHPLQRSFFTSSLAWMLALAIEQEPEEIGLWGVDMAASDEYGHQKPGCHYFILEAEKRGIKVTVPPQSCLLQPIPLYGLGESDPHRIKLEVRLKELHAHHAEASGKMAALDKAYREARELVSFYQGAIDDMQYHLNTWTE